MNDAKSLAEALAAIPPAPDPSAMVLPLDAYVALVRAAYPGRANVYRRLFLLFNAGCRGADLR